MALSGIFFARGDQPNANNSNINVTSANAVSIQFQTFGPDGDLILEQGVNGIDPDTQVSINGETFQDFTVVFTARLPDTGEADANRIPAALRGEEVVLIQVGSQRFFFPTDTSLATAGNLNAIRNGALSVFETDTTPPVQPVCFTRGARIATPDGERAIEALQAGDFVVTKDHGPQPIRWIGSRTVEAEGAFAPIRFAPGVLGASREVLVSPQHRMLVSGPRAELLFGAPEVLAKAKHLVDGDRIHVKPGGSVEYYHILLDAHEIIYVEGVAAESLHPGVRSLRLLDSAARAEILSLFPELASNPNGAAAARPSLTGAEARVFGVI